MVKEVERRDNMNFFTVEFCEGGEIEEDIPETSMREVPLSQEDLCSLRHSV